MTTAYADVDLSTKPTVEHLQLNPSKTYSVHDGFAYLVDVAQKWGLQDRVAQTFPFTVAGVIAGHEMLETHHAPGKLVVMQERAAKYRATTASAALRAILNSDISACLAR